MLSNKSKAARENPLLLPLSAIISERSFPVDVALLIKMHSRLSLACGRRNMYSTFATRQQMEQQLEYPYYDERDEKGLRVVFAIALVALLSIFVWAWTSKALMEQGAREWGSYAQNPPASQQPNVNLP
jgi:hypothetical protein